MAAADRTKQALAQALKELMVTRPLSKISVGEITRQAQMGRNTFYYHFKDKYDLVNWIFETESAHLLDDKMDIGNWQDYLSNIESYLQQNLAFYRNALEYNGQNSLQDYIFDVFERWFTERVRQVNGELGTHMREDEILFTAGFFASALQGLLVRSIRLGVIGEVSRYRECVRCICNGRMIEDYLNARGKHRDSDP